MGADPHPAVEPQPCPNCGASGRGPFCARCGRRLVTRTATLGDLLREGLDEVLGIERRFVRTTWSVMTRPGAVTEAYRAGVGNRYVSPVRMLFVAGAIWAGTGLWRGPSNLHFADVGLSYPTLALLAMPLFALALFVGYFRADRTYAEYLTFALYFQAAQLLVAAVVTPFPANAALSLTALFAVFYLVAGTRRLWGAAGWWGWLRAPFALVLYALSLLIVLMGASLTLGRLGRG